MRFLAVILFGFLFNVSAYGQTGYPGREPGKAVAHISGHFISLRNEVVSMNFRITGDRIHPEKLIDIENGDSLNLLSVPWFSITLSGGKTIAAKDFNLVGVPEIKTIASGPQAATCSDRYPGKMISATLVQPATGLRILWEVQLKEGSNYIVQRWVFHTKKALSVTKYSMLTLPSKGVVVDGKVDGSPLVYRHLFFALEHPMSHTEIRGGLAGINLPTQEMLHPSDSVVISTVSGVTPAGQLRRGFLYYVERERAHPYRPFLHYNSWFDLSWDDRKMEEVSCLDRIRMFGDSLVVKRHVPLKAFLFDDGWDNNASLWQISSSFPEGFRNMKRLAESYGARLGLWVSPWGGYDSAKEERLKFGRLQHPPFEMNKNGFSLSGPVYYKRFEKVTTDFIKKDGVAIFKFDGVGAGNGASGAGVSYQKDIESLLGLIGQLRHLEPNLYLNLTVGTWPSVYWLFYGDAIWRAGDDMGRAGSGTKRQQWITYRDGQSYKNVVQRAPLYPLNSVMLHGICISSLGYPATLDNDLKDVTDGIWSFFSSGTSLQELYINPHLLTTSMWDCLAAAATWSNENADVLQDVHWIGGDPEKGDVYGYAAWCPRKGVFSLRNPSSVEKTFILNLQHIFELPIQSAGKFILQNAIHPDDPNESKTVTSHSTISVTLKPYELKVWNATPEK